jgi:hypothetical protein
VSTVCRGLAFGLLAVLAGCVIIPYTPPSETQHDLADVPNPEQVLLSVGPRRFLEEMAEALHDQEPRIEYVDGQTFIDTAAPDGDLTLARLLDPATRDSIAGLQADYLVLLGEAEGEVLKTSGGMLAYIGFYGAQKTTGATRYWAALIDLRTMRLMEQLTTTSTGTDAGLGLFYGIFVVSNTEGSAQKGVIRNVAEVLSSARPEGPVRLVMLAREVRPTEAQLLAQAHASELLERRAPPFSLNRAAAFPPFSEPVPPQDGEALIYLYQPYEPAGSLHPQIVMTRGGSGEYELARIWSGGYFPYRVAAGSAEFWIAGQSGESLTIAAESGGTYFLRVDTRMGWKAPRGSLEIVEENEGRSEVILCRQLPSTRDALSTLRTRADDGYVFDQLELAQYLAIGVRYSADAALPRDPAEAFMWYTIVATTEGVADWLQQSAANARDTLIPQLSAQEIAEATLRAKAWQTAFAARFI